METKSLHFMNPPKSPILLVEGFGRATVSDLATRVPNPVQLGHAQPYELSQINDYLAMSKNYKILQRVLCENKS